MFVAHVSTAATSMNSVERSGERCVRCGTTAAREPSGYCPTCVIHTRIEIVTGLRRLTEYLAAWAAFDDWCRSRGAGPTSA
jgi:hypothetical protein